MYSIVNVKFTVGILTASYPRTCMYRSKYTRVPLLKDIEGV